MDPKAELLVFNKKEVVVIIVLLLLVALFSFTLGLRMGKTLTATATTAVEHAPLEPEAEKSAATRPPQDKDENPSAAKTGAEEPPAETTAAHGASEHELPTKAPDLAQQAEDQADNAFNEEVQKTHAAPSKPVALSLPAEKKVDAGMAGHYTLQVGSHRTVAEAAEQVAQLKRRDLDAFYLEAKVKGRGTWYRVGIGVFQTKEEAERAGEKWKLAKTLPPYIVQKVTE